MILVFKLLICSAWLIGGYQAARTRGFSMSILSLPERVTDLEENVTFLLREVEGLANALESIAVALGLSPREDLGDEGIALETLEAWSNRLRETKAKP